MNAESTREALDVASLAGDILLASGAEIFRVEETIDRIARAYGVNSSDAFVLSSGIFLTAESGKKQEFARVRHIPLSAARLDKVTAVNQLSREIEEGLHAPKEAKAWLLDIQRMPDKPRWHQVLASGVGSACFCFLFGGDVVDSMVAFLSGFVLYFYLLYLLRGRMSKIATNISGGALVTLIAVFLYQAGIGHHLDKVIIGSIIPLVPGLHRGFRADARCAACDILYCARRRTDYHRISSTGGRAAAMSDTIRLIAEFFAACVGTIAFALLFQVPRKYYLYCGLAGACGWICYKLILPHTTEPVSIFFATVLVILLSRSFAVYKRCPVTVFLIAGIFPLVPGSGIYWTAFYVVTNDLERAGARGFLTLKDAVAIVLGILFVFEFPQSWFRKVLTDKSK